MNGPRVLIADDDADLRELLAITFAGDGYQVEEVASGFELLARATGQEVDLVVADVCLPGLSGLEVLEGLNSPHRPEGWHTPVILITGYRDCELRAEAERLGAVVFDKPFDLDDLRTCAVNMVGPLLVRKQAEPQGHKTLWWWRRS